MIIPLDNVFDEHWIYVHRHQKTGFNIVVRALVNCSFSESQITQALDALSQKHPYLLGKVVEDPGSRQGCHFYLDTSCDNLISHKIEQATTVQIETLLKQPSARREYLFDIENGELANLQLWQNENQCLLEFSCVHLVGDVTAVLLLCKDLLHYLDQSIVAEPSVNEIAQRLPFDEQRYGWKIEPQAITPLPLPDGAPSNPEKWPPAKFLYGKYSMPLSKFNEIKTWLKKHGSDAAVGDLFYYVATRLYNEADESDLNFSVVLSFRNLLEAENEKNNINTSVIFSLIDIQDIDGENINVWLNKLNTTRKASLSHQGVMGLVNFLRCLNTSLYDADEQTGRALINAYLPINLFAFNNFGKVDHYFDHTNNFNVKEIDIQDGVPCQEVRVFSFKERLHIHPMLSPTGPFTPKTFWEKYTTELEKIILN